MLQQFLHERDLTRHRLTAHMALQGMDNVLGGEFAPAKVPLDAPPEVECPRLAVGTHAPVGGQHRHEMVPRVFLHQGFVYRRILSGVDDGHEYRIVLFALQLHCHLQTVHLGWSGRRHRCGGRRLCWCRASKGQQHQGHGHGKSAYGPWSLHDLLLSRVDHHLPSGSDGPPEASEYL